MGSVGAISKSAQGLVERLLDVPLDKYLEARLLAEPRMLETLDRFWISMVFNVIENLWGFDELRKLFVNVSHYPKQFGSVCFCICIRLLNGSMSEDVDVVINRMSDAKQF